MDCNRWTKKPVRFYRLYDVIGRSCQITIFDDGTAQTYNKVELLGLGEWDTEQEAVNHAFDKGFYYSLYR